MLPIDVENLILDYARGMNTHTKLENLYHRFLIDFKRIFQCVFDPALNEMNVCPLANPQWDLITPGPYIRFERAQMRMNEFAYRVLRAKANIGWWLERAYNDIAWGGTEILFWSSLPGRTYFRLFRGGPYFVFHDYWQPDLSNYGKDGNSLQNRIMGILHDNGIIVPAN